MPEANDLTKKMDVVVVEDLPAKMTEAQFRAIFDRADRKIKSLQWSQGSYAIVEYDSPAGILSALALRPLRLAGGHELSIAAVSQNKFVIKKVLRMTHDEVAITLAKRHDLSIQTVSWEDNARTKGSCWGPCISDMTLKVEDEALPVIRRPNFGDLTTDVALDDVMIHVGNERGEELKAVSLMHYLANFGDYQSTPLMATDGKKVSLVGAKEDTHAILSAQACMMPVVAGGSATFNVCVYNYQSKKGNPAVLVLVCTSKGTSAQVIENESGRYGSGQLLYHNKNGRQHSFEAVRLSDDRKARGVSPAAGAMSQKEKEDNMVMVVQIPIMYKKSESRSKGGGGAMYAMSAGYECCVQESAVMGGSRGAEPMDVEDAIVKVGEDQGPFVGLNGHVPVRDPAFPCRITLQMYKTTSNGVVDAAVMETIAKQVKTPDATSLVSEGKTGRKTEAKIQKSTEHPHPLKFSLSKMVGDTVVSLIDHQCNRCKVKGSTLTPRGGFSRCQVSGCDFDLCSGCMAATASASEQHRAPGEDVVIQPFPMPWGIKGPQFCVEKD